MNDWTRPDGLIGWLCIAGIAFTLWRCRTAARRR